VADEIELGVQGEDAVEQGQQVGRGVASLIMSRQKAISVPASTRASSAASLQSSCASSAMIRCVARLLQVGTSQAATPKL